MGGGFAELIRGLCDTGTPTSSKLSTPTWRVFLLILPGDTSNIFEH